MSVPTMQEGEIGVVFRFYLKENGNPFDVSGATAIDFIIEGNGSRAMTVEDAENGQIRYVSVNGDFTRGTHESQVIVTYDDGGIPTPTITKRLKSPVFLITVSPSVALV